MGLRNQEAVLICQDDLFTGMEAKWVLFCMNDSDVESQSEFELDSFPKFANPIHEKDSVVVAIKAMMTLKSFITHVCHHFFPLT